MLVYDLDAVTKALSFLSLGSAFHTHSVRLSKKTSLLINKLQ